MTNIKATWSFYTPEWLSDFICEHVQNNLKQFKHSINLLEPSCGDGVFLRSLTKNEKIKNELNSVTIFETSKEELRKAKSILECIDYQEDFLLKDDLGKYDLILWNPPYIDKKYLSKEQRESYRKWYEYGGIGDKTILNIWPAFVYKSEYLLSENGVLGFVLPEELLRVNYWNHVLDFLKNHFERIEIFMINKVIFGEAWQNTVVIFAFKRSKFRWVYQWNIDVGNQNDVNHTIIESRLSKTDLSLYSQKDIWTQLDADSLKFIEGIGKKFHTIWHYTNSRTWVVTGANNFFILNNSDVIKYWLRDACIPIIQKGSHISKWLVFGEDQFQYLLQKDKACFLLHLKWINESPNVLNYLQIGERIGLHKRFKLWSYKPNWYNVPNIGTSSLIFFKRTHLCPKLILNTYNAEVTDSWYRIELKDKWFEEQFQYCFYNSFTLLMMEILWRFYGWGVLELTPNEFKKIPIPFSKEIPKENIELFHKRDINDIELILEENDEFILWKIFKFSAPEIQRIKQLRQYLLNNRIK